MSSAALDDENCPSGVMEDYENFIMVYYLF
jgi:hypothetical protein